MSKPYTEAILAEQLSRDRTWRIREISDLKVAVKRADSSLRQVLLRSLVTICYAHWEGSVRLAARKYLEHIALRKFRFDQLNPQFLRNYFLPRLASLANSKGSISERCDIVDEILSGPGNQFKRVNEDLVNTKSNLNYDVLKDICLVCGISLDAFEGRETFIDIVLLKRRNAIAHGEDTLIGLEDLDLVADGTVELMRAFGDALENHAYLGAYKAA
ncbi:MAE_28990/MAE_18760 family HEPN-like nuclease [Phenylobacterium conjunctum]|uniref:MAE_28990/MAE_18760 family HEPN-like nuclease n=1 Tax=Phenylobacterium conjunctum TaxID=1298959 RepID=A0ABW3T131_9CAUL